MKKISDYKEGEALDLWAEILEPAAVIMADKEILSIYQSGKPKILMAKYILKNYKKEMIAIMKAIDPAPVNGLNLITRTLAVIAEIGQEIDPGDLGDFFTSPDQNGQDITSGSRMANTEDGAK